MLLADENVDRAIVDRLRIDGFDVVWIAETAPAAEDEHVLALATADARVLVTSDKDFGELVFRQGRANAGVVLIRLPGLSPADKADVVARALAAHSRELAGAFTVITSGLVRIRRAP